MTSAASTTTPTDLPAIGRVGIWTSVLNSVPPAEGAAIAAELERLGYGALWLSDGLIRDPYVLATLALAATSRLVFATGIANIRVRSAVATAAAVATLNNAFPRRFLSGLGVSHAELVEPLLGEPFDRPVGRMADYLARIDAAAERGAAPVHPRVLAALGPKMLELSRDQADGAHPYLTTPAHTAFAREVLGPGKLLAPEQAVVLSTDRETVLARGRQHLTIYLRLPNYVNNWRRLGFDEADFAQGGSERLVEALVAGGDTAAIRQRIDEHLAAGADHVCLQVLGPDPRVPPLEDWRALAPEVLA
jgi:probable F420-dependent oxidoreductase